MGYTTSFTGRFDLDKELTASQYTKLKSFADERHEVENTPGYNCMWEPTEDGKGLEWNGGEKFYDYVQWLEHLIERFFEPWKIKVNGNVAWQGESFEDRGEIIVVGNKVTEAKLPTAEKVSDLVKELVDALKKISKGGKVKNLEELYAKADHAMQFEYEYY